MPLTTVRWIRRLRGPTTSLRARAACPVVICPLLQPAQTFRAGRRRLATAIQATQNAGELQDHAEHQRDCADDDAGHGDVVLVTRLLGLPIGNDADDQADQAAEEGENQPYDAKRSARISGSRSWRVGLVLSHWWKLLAFEEVESNSHERTGTWGRRSLSREFARRREPDNFGSGLVAKWRISLPGVLARKIDLRSGAIWRTATARSAGQHSPSCCGVVPQPPETRGGGVRACVPTRSWSSSTPRPRSDRSSRR